MKTQSRTIILAAAALGALTSLGVGALALQLPAMRAPLPTIHSDDVSCPPDACTIVFKSQGGTPSDMRTAQNTGGTSVD